MLFIDGGQMFLDWGKKGKRSGMSKGSKGITQMLISDTRESFKKEFLESTIPYYQPTHLRLGYALFPEFQTWRL